MITTGSDFIEHKEFMRQICRAERAPARAYHESVGQAQAHQPRGELVVQRVGDRRHRGHHHHTGPHVLLQTDGKPASTFLFSDHFTRQEQSAEEGEAGRGRCTVTMRTSSQRLAAVRKREAMLLASVNCSSRCLNLGSYLQAPGDRSVNLG